MLNRGERVAARRAVRPAFVKPAELLRTAVLEGRRRVGEVALLKVVGTDAVDGSPRSLIVKTDDERLAWQRAESKGIVPRDVVHFPLGEPEPPTSDRKGVVYLLRCGSYYKIGKSTDPERRYGRLKIQLPEKPELVHEIVTNDVDYTERHWHRRFAPQRANGEWFLLSTDEVNEFRKCKRVIVDLT